MLGVQAARVVAVIAKTDTGRTQVGSGYLLDASRVLTAWHCTVDIRTERAAVSLKVVRPLDGADAAVVVSGKVPGLDVSLLVVDGNPPWGAEMPGGPVAFGRVDREHAGQLEGCEAVGLPRWQAAENGIRELGEVHGVIRVLEGLERQRLVLRDPVLGGVTAADGSLAWAGFSGAAVFHDGLLIGVIIEQHARRGDTALHIRPVESIAKSSDDDARRLAEALGIGSADALPLVAVGPGRWRVETAGEEALSQWGWSLASDEEGVRHWRPRARGVSNQAQRGWRFRGRTRALERIVDWLDRPRPDRQVLVVTGSPGAGKSAVLGRIVTTADSGVRAALPTGDIGVWASPGSVSCAVHAKGKTALDVAKEIARAARASPPGEAADLAAKVQDALGERGARFNVVIDALDEAVSPEQARDVIDHVVLPLAQDCADVGVQVVVGTRRRDDRGDLLNWFGPAVELLDLDDRDYFKPDDLAAYAQACLQLDGDDGNLYANAAVAGPLAIRIARVSGQNFLIAGLIARSCSLHPEAVDPGQLAVPQTVRSALDRYLWRLDPVAGVPADCLLTALAFAESPGLPAGLWQLAVKTLYRVDVIVEDLAEFARSAAANFLVETADTAATDTTDPAVMPTYRLFHQALNDTLLHTRADVVPRTADEQSLARAFTARGRDEGWEGATAYLLRSLPAHAARAGLVDDLLADDDYLLHADLLRVRRVANQAASDVGLHRARLLRLPPDEAISADPPARAAMLGVTEVLEGAGDSYQRSIGKTPYRAAWATAPQSQEHLVLRGHDSVVNAVCAYTAVDGTPCLATASDDETIRIWDLETGTAIHTFTSHDGAVNAVCAYTSVDGTPCLATASDDETIRIWDLETGTAIHTLNDRSSGVRSICSYIAADGAPFLVTASDDEIARIWNTKTGAEIRALNGRHHWIRSVCAFTSVDGEPRLATTSHDEIVRIWDPETGTQTRALNGHNGDVNAVCAFTTADGTPRLATASNDTTARIWNPDNGAQTRTLNDHRGRFGSICPYTTVDGTARLATRSDDQSVRIWDLETGAEIRTLNDRRSLAGSGSVCAYTSTDGAPRLASLFSDRAVRIWDPETGAEIRTLNEGRGRRQSESRSVCAYTTVDGRPRLATGSRDRTVWIWDPETGAKIRILNDDHNSALRSNSVSMCAYTTDGAPHLAVAFDNQTIQIWNSETDTHDGIEIRDLSNPRSWVALMSLCAYTTTKGAPRLASTFSDRVVRIWDSRTGAEIRTLNGHNDRVGSMCSYTTADGTPRLATGSSDRTVRIWDPELGTSLLTIPVRDEVVSVAWSRGLLVIGTATALLAIRLRFEY